MDLNACKEMILSGMKEHMVTLLEKSPAVDYAEACHELSKHFQGLAICHLLIDGNVEKYFSSLCFSGYARRFFLSSCQAEQATHRNLAISKNESFLDVIVAGHFHLARDIFDLSSNDWNPKWEYEDDWCFYRFMHLFADSFAANDSKLQQVLEQWAAVLEQGGDDDLRLPVCTSLVDRDGDKFNESLLEFAEDCEAKMDKVRAETTDPYFIRWPRTFANMEALAICRVAANVNLEPQEELPLCPPDALPNIDKFPDDFFLDIPKIQNAD